MLSLEGPSTPCVMSSDEVIDVRFRMRHVPAQQVILPAWTLRARSGRTLISTVCAEMIMLKHVAARGRALVRTSLSIRGLLPPSTMASVPGFLEP